MARKQASPTHAYVQAIGLDAYKKAAALFQPAVGALDTSPSATYLTAEAMKAVEQVITGELIEEEGTLRMLVGSFTSELGKSLDKTITRSSKALLNQIAAGQLPFAQLFEDLIIPVGEGSRPFFRDLTTTQMILWDNQEFKSAHQHMSRYAEKRENIWEPNFAAISPLGITPTEARRLNLIKLPHALSW